MAHPIPFPDYEAIEKVRQRIAAEERADEADRTAEALRVNQAVSAARFNGIEEGRSLGWQEGFKMGRWVGAFIGGFLTVVGGGVILVGLTQLIGLHRV